MPDMTAMADSSEVDPALVYALPPVGLGHGFGFSPALQGTPNLQSAGHQGYDVAALANLLSAGLQEERTLPVCNQFWSVLFNFQWVITI